MPQGISAQVMSGRRTLSKRVSSILMHAAAGENRLILCQWAAALGATVIGTVSTEAKAELAHANGCKHTILYSKQDFVAEVARISGGEKLPVIFDSVGKDNFLRSSISKSTRTDVTFGQASGPIDPIAPVLLSQKRSLLSNAPTPLPLCIATRCARSFRERVFDVVASGKGRINVNQRFALKDAADVHKALEARATSRSTILTI